MKKNSSPIIYLFVLICFCGFNAQAQVGIGTTTISDGAILDITSTDKGLLIPRVNITDLATSAPITTPTEGLMVYNTNSTTGPGFFYWDGTAWVPVGGSSGNDHDWYEIGSSPTAVADDITDNIYTQGAVTIGDDASDGSASLELADTDKGFLPNRVALTATNSSGPITAPATGLLVYNTATASSGDTAVFPGYYYWNGSEWMGIGFTENRVKSVSLAADIILASSTFSDIAGTTLTFVAKKTSVLVDFSASGFSDPGSLGYVLFRIKNAGTGTIIGGTNTVMQSAKFVDPPGNNNEENYSITSWSVSFSKLLTGLTIGNTYNLIVEGKTVASYGLDGAYILPVTDPDLTSHLTLSVIQ
ncbi:MAG TPA: hypothetical protein VFM70_00725 [Salinimicrobium sp.]|nr:hypothetical protein [Salinimicrobium sp.]